MGLSLEGLVRSVKNVLGTTFCALGLGAGLLFGGAGMSGCFEEEDVETEAIAESNFSATGGNYEINLSWDLKRDDEIMIRRRQEIFPTNPTDGNFVYQGEEKSYIDTGLEADVLYCYRIFFVNPTDPISTSDLITSARPYDGTPPSPVTSFIAVSTEGGMQLSWVNPTDTDFAEVSIWRINGSSGQLVYRGTDQSAVDNGLNSNISYNYSAQTFDNIPNQSIIVYSGLQNPLPLIPPAEVSNFIMIPNYSENIHKWSVTLSWLNPIDSDFAGVIVVKNLETAPINRSDGTVVYQGAGQYLRDTNLDDGNYFYAIYTFDQIPNHSSGQNLEKKLDYVYALGWIGDSSNGWKTYPGTSSATDYQSFFFPEDVALDSNGNIYVADSARICKWDSTGNAIGWIGGGSNGWKTSSSCSGGLDYQSLMGGKGIFIDNNGNIYIADYQNHRVCKWDAQGNALGWIGEGSNGWKTTDGASSGSDYQSFNYPKGIFVDGDGNIYVAERHNHRISKWDAQGNAIGWIGDGQDNWRTDNANPQWSNINNGLKYFAYPADVFVFNGDIYIADSTNERISKWSDSGNAIGWLGGTFDGWQTGNNPFYTSDYKGFRRPDSIFIDSNGNIYVADRDNYRVCKRSSDGTPAGWIGGNSNGWQKVSGASAANDYQSFGISGYYGPKGVCVAANGNIYIADSMNRRISKWQD
ncbi:MAG: NHL repeat-containing protein [Nanoarchaeota archaeon]|nr:NHL repeat-containing protein [Nanoarchaeota archaeon]